MRSPLYGPAYEQLAGTERMVELLLAGRRLQLATSMPEQHTPRASRQSLLQDCRAKVLAAAKEMVTSAIHLGSANLLGKCDICRSIVRTRLMTVLAFRLLVAGRMLLAVALSARSETDRSQQEEAESAAQAVSLLLRHLASVLPISLGSAEVFDETCRGEPRAKRADNQFAGSHCVKRRPAVLRITHGTVRSVTVTGALSRARPLLPCRPWNSLRFRTSLIRPRTISISEA